MKKLLYVIILILFMNNITQTMNMKIDQDNSTKQSLSFLALPYDIYYYIASYLHWKDILQTSLTCKYLDVNFNDPTRPIPLGYIKQRKPHVINKFFKTIFDQLQAFHKKRKFDLNPITLVLLQNKLSEAPARRALGTFLQQLNEQNMSCHIKMIDMSLNHLTQPLHPAITNFTHLHKVAFFGNDPKAITSFPERFPALQKLGITVYNKDTDMLGLENWSHLQKLDLDIKSVFENLNFLRELPDLTHLRSLRMHGTETDIIYFFPILVALHINPRTTLKSENIKQICQIPSLQKLGVHNFDMNINIGELATYIAAIKQLKKLHLRNINILCQQNIQDYSKIQLNEETHRYISTDPTTPVINPEDNLEAICQALMPTNKLEVLDISYNKLRSLPPSLMYLTHLKQLNLFANMLETLPDELTQLTQLEELNISTLPELELEIDTPELEFKPEIFTQMPNLRNLFLFATRPRSNNLPLVQKFIQLQQQLSENPDELASIRRHLNHLKEQDDISPFTQRCMNIVEKTLALLNPTIKRSQLEGVQIIIEQLLKKDVHPLQDLQQTLEIAHRAHNQNPRPKKRQKINKSSL